MPQSPKPSFILGPRSVENRDYGVVWVRQDVDLDDGDLRSLSLILARVRNWPFLPEGRLARLRLRSGKMVTLEAGGGEFLASKGWEVAVGGRYLSGEVTVPSGLPAGPLEEALTAALPDVVVPRAGVGGWSDAQMAELLAVLDSFGTLAYAAHPLASKELSPNDGFAEIRLAIVAGGSDLSGHPSLKVLPWQPGDTLSVGQIPMAEFLVPIMTTAGLPAGIEALLGDVQRLAQSAAPVRDRIKHEFLAAFDQWWNSCSAAAGAEDWAMAHGLLAPVEVKGNADQLDLLARELGEALEARLKRMVFEPGRQTGVGLLGLLDTVNPAPYRHFLDSDDRLTLLVGAAQEQQRLRRSDRPKAEPALDLDGFAAGWFELLADEMEQIVPFRIASGIPLYRAAKDFEQRFLQLPSSIQKRAIYLVRIAAVLYNEAPQSLKAIPRVISALGRLSCDRDPIENLALAGAYVPLEQNGWGFTVDDYRTAHQGLTHPHGQLRTLLSRARSLQNGRHSDELTAKELVNQLTTHRSSQLLAAERGCAPAR